MNLHKNVLDNRHQLGETAEIRALKRDDGNNIPEFRRNRTQGHITHCDGKTAIIAANDKADDPDSDGYWAVGQLISVIAGKNRIVGLIFKVEAQDSSWHVESDNRINIHIELIGEITDGNDGKSSFKSGISTYPHLGAVAHKIRAIDLAAIYENTDKNTAKIGSITQDPTIPALVSIDSLLSRHFAIVGTTGVGKSTSVALIIRKIIETRPDIRTLILDPHNEFAAAFPDLAVTVDAASLELPFWMFNFEELVEVIYRGRSGIGAEIDALRDLIPEAKILYENGPESTKTVSLAKKIRGTPTYTIDTPVPYRMPDLIKLMDDRIGQLEGKSERPHLKSLKNRLSSVMNDPRFNFMFENRSGANAMGNLLAKVFRIPQNNKPICVFELSGLPSEVVNVVASVMCRLAFDLGSSSRATIQTLVICEEAHRYIPADPNAGFLPTRLAIAKIAKEGRKYGVYLGVVTQRPGELDTTILSQCNTIFSMRLGSDHDQEIVRKAITGAANSTVSFLSSLANRECIAFGEAIDAPMRMTFDTVTKQDLPGSNVYKSQLQPRDPSAPISLSSVIIKMCELGTGASSPQNQEHDFMDRVRSEDRVGIDQGADRQPALNPVDPTPKLQSAPVQSTQVQSIPVQSNQMQSTQVQSTDTSPRLPDQLQPQNTQPASSAPGFDRSLPDTSYLPQRQTLSRVATVVDSHRKDNGKDISRDNGRADSRESGEETAARSNLVRDFRRR